VAATFEKAKTYIFAETQVRDREVGGSNPLALTNESATYRRQLAVFFRRSPICAHFLANFQSVDG
jgi:hypothetical protein